MGSKKTTEKGSSSQKFDPYITEGAQKAVGIASRVADRDYTAYSGQRVADLSANEQQASNLAGSNVAGQKAQGDFDRARAAIGNVKTFDQANLSAYMNPYMEQVLAPQKRMLDRNLAEKRNNLASSAAARTAFGGDRQTILESQLESDYQQNLGEITGVAYAKAFDSAVQAFQQDQDRQLRAADAWRQTGGDTTRMNTQQIQDLLATGGLSRMIEQGKLDTSYQTFLEERDWDITNLEPLLQALERVPKNQSAEYKKETKESGGVAGQVIGAVATVAAAYFTGGASLAAGAAAGGAAKGG